MSNPFQHVCETWFDDLNLHLHCILEFSMCEEGNKEAFARVKAFKCSSPTLFLEPWNSIENARWVVERRLKIRGNVNLLTSHERKRVAAGRWKIQKRKLQKLSDIFHLPFSPLKSFFLCSAKGVGRKQWIHLPHCYKSQLSSGYRKVATLNQVNYCGKDLHSFVLPPKPHHTPTRELESSNWTFPALSTSFRDRLNEQLCQHTGNEVHQDLVISLSIIRNNNFP